MKRLLFSATSLDVGGIETALVSLLNHLAKLKENNEYKYEITLVLEHKQGLFMDDLDRNIKIMQYTPSNHKIILLRKISNFLKQVKFRMKNKNKYDFSVSFATYSNPGAFIARTASKNSALWCHMDYLAMFENDKQKVEEFFLEKHYKKFKYIVFVSQKSKETFLEVFPNEKDKVKCIHNLINYEQILRQSEENVADFKREKDTTVFINIGRHDEKQKRLTRLIEASRKLKENTNKKFKILFVGEGEDTDKYKELAKQYGLKEIVFLGRKKNPYPYLKMADYTLVTSEYEGYPVVYVESMVLNKPIITTMVSGVDEIKSEGYAIVTEKEDKSIYKAMKNVLEKGFNLKNKFDPEKYNKDIILKIEKMIWEK